MSLPPIVDTSPPSSVTQSNSPQSTSASSPTQVIPQPADDPSRTVNQLASEFVSSGKISQFIRIKLVDSSSGELNAEIAEILQLDEPQSERLRQALYRLVNTLAYLRSQHCTIERVDETSLLANIGTFAESGQEAYRNFIGDVASVAGPTKAAALDAMAGPSFQNEFFDFGGTPMGYQLTHITSYENPHGLQHFYDLATIYDKGNSRGYNTSSGPLESIDGFAPGVLPIFSEEAIESITQGPKDDLKTPAQ